MQKTIDVTDLQDRLCAVLDEVVHQQVFYVLARGSDPEAVVIPYDQFLQYQKLAAQGAYDLLERLQAGRAAQFERFSEEEVAEDVAAAIREVRTAGTDLEG